MKLMWVCNMMPGAVQERVHGKAGSANWLDHALSDLRKEEHAIRVLCRGGGQAGVLDESCSFASFKDREPWRYLPQVEEFRIIQTAPETALVLLRTSTGELPQGIEELKADYAALLPGTEFSFELTDEIPPLPSGKKLALKKNMPGTQIVRNVKKSSHYVRKRLQNSNTKSAERLQLTQSPQG